MVRMKAEDDCDRVSLCKGTLCVCVCECVCVCVLAQRQTATEQARKKTTLIL